MDFCSWTGRELEEIKRTKNEKFSEWQLRPHVVRFDNGEDLASIRTRALNSINEIIKTHGGENIAIVSHRVVCKVLLLSFLGEDNDGFWRIPQDICCINEIEYDHDKEEYMVKEINNTDHLDNSGIVPDLDDF